MSTQTSIQAIKAELYDLQSHVCNGQLTIRPDGKRDPGDRMCTGCTRIMKLQYVLQQITKKEI